MVSEIRPACKLNVGEEHERCVADKRETAMKGGNFGRDLPHKGSDI